MTLTGTVVDEVGLNRPSPPATSRLLGIGAGGWVPGGSGVATSCWTVTVSPLVLTELKPPFASQTPIGEKRSTARAPNDVGDSRTHPSGVTLNSFGGGPKSVGRGNGHVTGLVQPVGLVLGCITG